MEQDFRGPVSTPKHSFLGVFYAPIEREREMTKWPIVREQKSWVGHKDMQVMDTLAIKKDSNLQATHPSH